MKNVSSCVPYVFLLKASRERRSDFLSRRSKRRESCCCCDKSLRPSWLTFFFIYFFSFSPASIRFCLVFDACPIEPSPISFLHRCGLNALNSGDPSRFPEEKMIPQSLIVRLTDVFGARQNGWERATWSDIYYSHANNLLLFGHFPFGWTPIKRKIQTNPCVEVARNNRDHSTHNQTLRRVAVVCCAVASESLNSSGPSVPSTAMVHLNSQGKKDRLGIVAGLVYYMTDVIGKTLADVAFDPVSNQEKRDEDAGWGA